jgi:hypothetical protein
MSTPTPVVRAGRTTVTSIVVSGVLATSAVLALVLGDDLGWTVVVIGTVLLVAGYFIAFHPKLVLFAFPVALGAAPFMHVPFTDIPMLLALSAMLWVAISFVPDLDVRLGLPEAVVAVVAAVTFCSLVATDVSGRALVEWIAWVAATAVLIPIRQLPATLRRRVCEVFAMSASVGSALAIAIWFGLPRSILKRLDVLGYDVDRNGRYVSGERITTRLAGTFLEPNIAGLILLVALAAAVVFLSGRLRTVAVVLITVALLLTLSRAAFGTALLAAALVALRRPERRRDLALWGGGVIVLALSIPSVRSRLANSLGARDVGLADRRDALAAFPGLMEGHWVWGLGWARPEFRNAGLTQAVNFVANGPLLTVYRGGLVVGIVIVVVAVIVAFRAWAYADRSFAAAVVCALLIAMTVVAFQLDFPIVNQAPATAAVSLLIAMTLFVPEEPTEPDARPEQ